MNHVELDDDEDDRLSIDDAQPDALLLGVANRGASYDDDDDDDDQDRDRDHGNEQAPPFDLSGAGRAKIPWRWRWRRRWPTARTPRLISSIACIAIFLWVFSGMLAMVPGTRVVEEILCRRYHPEHFNSSSSLSSSSSFFSPPPLSSSPSFPLSPPREDASSNPCKSARVQSSLAWLFGTAMALDSGVSLLVALPYGALADRAGRRFVYFLAAAGQVASIAWSLLVMRAAPRLPVEWILLGPVFMLVGGGGISVAIVVLYAVVADVNGAEDRAMIYFFTSLAANMAVFIGPPLASATMEIWTPWVPLSLSFASALLAGAIVLFVPETAAAAVQRTRKPGTNNNHHHHNKNNKKLKSWRAAIRSKFVNPFLNTNLNLNIRSTLHLLRNGPIPLPLLLLLLSSLLASPLSNGGTGPLFLQYYSARFARSVEEAGYVLAVRGGLTIVVVGALLPFASSKLLSYCSSRPFRRDLVLARLSAGAAGLGYVLLGAPKMGALGAGVVVLALSVGLGPLCRALVAALVRPEMTSRVFMVVTVVEGLGALPAGPLLAWAFSEGMRLGGVWFGLPYFVLGALGFLSLVALCFIPSGCHGPEPCLADDDDGLDGLARTCADADTRLQDAL